MPGLTLMLVAIWSVTMIAVFLRFRRKAKIESYRYRLFKCRDDLFRLVAVQSIDEGNLVFQESSNLLNGMIRHLDHFTLNEFAKAFVESETEGNADQARWEKFSVELCAAPEAAQRIHFESIKTILGILYDSSPTLRFLLWLRKVIRTTGISVRSLFGGHPPQAYEAYRAGESRIETLPHAFAA